MNDFRLFPEQASSVAPGVDTLFLLLIGVTGSIALVVFGLITWYAIRYRRRPGDPPPPQSAGSTWVEVAWTGGTTAVFLGLFLLGARSYVAVRQVPEEGLEVYVVAKQWMWKAQHRDGAREIDEIHVPVGRPVRLLMTSEDVIHSFYVPAFRVKMDVVPGRYTTAWFEATRTGEFRLFCAEYCGTKHSGMTGRIVVMQPDRYADWLASRSTAGPLAESGAELFRQYRCSACHADRDTDRGPALHGLLGRTVLLADGSRVVADPEYVRESVLEPLAKVTAGWEPVMPPYAGQLTEEELFRLIAHVAALAPARPPDEPGEPEEPR